MPVVIDPYIVATPHPNPLGQSNAGVAYISKPKSYYLYLMLAQLRAGGSRIYSPDTGSVPYRFLNSVAVAAAYLDQGLESIVDRAVRYSAYEAHGFSALPITYATGLGSFTRKSKAPSAEVIPVGTIIGAVDGKTAVTLAQVNIAEGATSSAPVLIRAEAAGSSGNAGAGAFTQILSAVPGAYTVTNIGNLDGGSDGETEDQMRRRFQDYILSSGSGTALAIKAAALAATAIVASVTVAPRTAGVIHPWRVAGLGHPPGTFYVVVESGGGVAPPELVAAVQSAIDLKTAAGNQGIVISCAAFVVTPSVSYTYTTGASTASIDASIQSAWTDFCSDTQIELGGGEGDLDTSSLENFLLNSNANLRSLSVNSPTGVLSSPLASRIIPGSVTFVTRTAI